MIQHDPKGRFGKQDPTLRFMAKVQKEENGCWSWSGFKIKEGYGRFKLEDQTQYAHRASYILFVGVIPEDMTVDHLCRNRGCVNPEHLEVVTQRENSLRGCTLNAKNLAKTHCPRGHEYTKENTHITRSGSRKCRACDRIRMQGNRASRSKMEAA